MEWTRNKYPAGTKSVLRLSFSFLARALANSREGHCYTVGLPADSICPSPLTDRQTDRRTERQKDRETERQTGRQADRQRERERKTERQRDRSSYKMPSQCPSRYVIQVVKLAKKENKHVTYTCRTVVIPCNYHINL